MSVRLSSTNLQFSHLYLSSYLLIIYSHSNLTNGPPISSLLQTGNSLLRSNLFVLFVLAALLLDCRFPCAWTSSTTIFPESKSPNGRLTDAKPPGSSSWIVPQGFLKTNSSRNSRVSCEATNSSSSTTRGSSRPACSGGVLAFIRSRHRAPRDPNI